MNYIVEDKTNLIQTTLTEIVLTFSRQNVSLDEKYDLALVRGK